MRKLFLLGLSLLAVAAMAMDFPALPDGGSLVTSTGSVPPADGGGPWVTIDTGHTEDWVPAIRCHTSTIICGTASPRVHYRFSADGGTASPAYGLLDVDRTFDLPVIQPKATERKLRYLSLLGEDGGPPCCSLHQPDPVW